VSAHSRVRVMRQGWPRTLLLLSLFCLPALCQDPPSSIKIGVALPAGATKEISDTALRDQWVKEINDHKHERKLKMEVDAVPLDASPGIRAVVEAREKKCAFLLYVYLQPPEDSNHYVPSYDGMTIQNQAVARGKIEYLLRRVGDSSAYAAGTAQSDEMMSDREAILQAAKRVPERLLANFERGLSAGAHTASGMLEKLTPVPTLDAQGGEFCAWLPKNIPHADALRGACEYASTLHEKMPNFICHEETSRYEGRNRIPSDLITASVRYEDGEESYSDFKRNGKSVSDATVRAAGLWSIGQFSSNLRDIFHRANDAVFQFAGEKKVGNRAAWVFTYSIAHQNETLWQLRANEQADSPPYDGEVWVDQEGGAVLRFEAAAKHLPPSFPMQRAEMEIDYGAVVFGDGTSFVLPFLSTISTQFAGFEPTRNMLRFQGCHKFGAMARMVLEGSTANTVPSAATSSDEGRIAESEEDEAIYSILREEAIGEDARRTALEQQNQLNEMTRAAMWRLGTLESEGETRANEALAAKSLGTVRVDSPTMTLRVTVKLVPVTVVVRDQKGNAVGNLLKKDFELFDERKPQTISSFSMQKNAGENSTANAGAGTGSERNREAAGSPFEQNATAYVFDDLHAEMGDLAKARHAASQQLTELGARDLVGIFTTSGEVMLDFTGNREQLEAALSRLRPHPTPGWDCPPMSYYMADLIVNHSDAVASGVATEEARTCAKSGTVEMARRLALSRALELVNSGRADSRRVLAVLRDVIHRTAAMPGKRSIVLASPGFLEVDFGAEEESMQLIQNAVSAGVVVNAIDVGGVLDPGVSATAGSAMADRGQLDRQAAVARSQIMSDLAYGTGGIFFQNNNDLREGFRRTTEVPQYIYVLGFSPQTLDGKFHKLRVKVSSVEKLTVKARPGYYALKPPAGS
jgi:VWFA-related protein